MAKLPNVELPDIKLPEATFGLGVTETQYSETIGVNANEPNPGEGGGPYWPITCVICSCRGPGSSSVKKVAVLRKNLYKIK